MTRAFPRKPDNERDKESRNSSGYDSQTVVLIPPRSRGKSEKQDANAFLKKIIPVRYQEGNIKIINENEIKEDKALSSLETKMKNITISSDDSLGIEKALCNLKIDGNEEKFQKSPEEISDDKCKILPKTDPEKNITSCRTKQKNEEEIKKVDCKKDDTESTDNNKSDAVNCEKPKPRLIERGPLKRDTSKPQVLPYTTIYTSKTHQSIGIAMCCPPASNRPETPTVKLKLDGYNPFAYNIVELPPQKVQEERDALCEAITNYMTTEQMNRVFDVIDNVGNKASPPCDKNQNERNSQSWPLLDDSGMPTLDSDVPTMIKEINDCSNGYESCDSLLSPESSLSPFSPTSQVVPDPNRVYRYASDRSTSSGISGSPTSCLSLSPIPTSHSPFSYPPNHMNLPVEYSLSDADQNLLSAAFSLPDTNHNIPTTGNYISEMDQPAMNSNYSEAERSYNMPPVSFSITKSSNNVITPAGYTMSVNKVMSPTDNPQRVDHVPPPLPQPPPTVPPPPLNNKNNNYSVKKTVNYFTIPNNNIPCQPSNIPLNIPPPSLDYTGRQSRVNQPAQLLPRPVIPKAVTTPGVDRLLQKLDDESKDTAWAAVYSVADVETLCKGDDKDGDTRLMIMVCNWKDKYFGMLYALVERLKNVPGALTKRNRCGHSAFFLACMFAFREPIVARYIADTLLKMGEDIHIVDQYGNTLLHSLCMRGDTHVQVLAEILGLKNSKGEPYFDINQQNCEGGTPLHVAVANDGYMGRSTIETVGLLLDQGADASIKRHCDDCTPLLVACKGNCRPIILEMLLTAHNGAVIQGDVKLNTPLHVIVQRDLPWERQRQAINLILDFGSQYRLQTRQNRDGKTVLAVTPADKKDKVRLLLRGR